MQRRGVSLVGRDRPDGHSLRMPLQHKALIPKSSKLPKQSYPQAQFSTQRKKLAEILSDKWGPLYLLGDNAGVSVLSQIS